MRSFCPYWAVTPGTEGCETNTASWYLSIVLSKLSFALTGVFQLLLCTPPPLFLMLTCILLACFPSSRPNWTSTSAHTSPCLLPSYLTILCDPQSGSYLAIVVPFQSVVRVEIRSSWSCSVLWSWPQHFYCYSLLPHQFLTVSKARWEM